MFSRRLIALLFLGTLAVPAAEAHVVRQHKGKPAQGTVTSISENRLELQTAKRKLTVTFQPNTNFERGDEKITWEAIQVGNQVRVFGTKLSSGELVAREVLLSPKGKHAAAPSSSPATSQEQAAVEQKEG